ncbi:hypothetical protein [Nitratireductor sp. GCM10026969]|uniref:hypothetical protein n=1 Tax=Nitratireductor sp. GCM10026969 TaxID=3252645 RepID=UPI003622242E
MGKDRPKRHVKAETKLTETTRAEREHERMKARPDAEDLKDPEEVWKDAESTPARDRSAEVATGGERVADAGDVGAGQASPYGTEAQADALARQTERTGEQRGVEKPKKQ